MEHPTRLRPAEHAVYTPNRMSKTTLFHSPRLLVGLNAFEPGQEHALHTHAGQDKVYLILEGAGVYLHQDEAMPVQAGDLLTAPADLPHGLRNPGPGRLLVLAILAPAPPAR